MADALTLIGTIITTLLPHTVTASNVIGDALTVSIVAGPAFMVIRKLISLAG